MLGKLDSYMQKNETRTFSNTVLKKKKISKWIKDLNLRPETMELPEENTGRTPFDINCSSIFGDLPPTAK